MSVLPFPLRSRPPWSNSTHMGAEQVGLLSAPHPGDVDAGERRSVAWRTSKWSWPASPAFTRLAAGLIAIDDYFAP